MKAGTNVSVNIPEANWTQWINQAESYINLVVREDLTTGFSGYSASYKEILSDFCSSYAAPFAVNWDPSDYSSSEVTNNFNLNWATVQRIIDLLKVRDQATATLMGE